MNLSHLTLTELEDLLIRLPDEIRRREDEVREAEHRKRRVFLEFQALAAKQGVDFDALK
jgi:predicted transcriptional regulator